MNVLLNTMKSPDQRTEIRMNNARNSLAGARTVVALAALCICGAVQATEAWTPTRTLKQDPGIASAAPVSSGKRVHVTVTLRPRDQAGLDAFTPTSSELTAHHLAREEFLQRFAPTVAQAQAVVDHLRQAGFVNLTLAANRMLVSADGDAAAVRAAFDAELVHATLNGRDVFWNTSDAKIPESLAGIVNAVHGLQDIVVPHTTIKVAGRVDANALAAASKGSSGPVAIAHNPPEFSTIYDADRLAPAAHATVGIIATGDVTQTLADLQTFAQNNSFPAPDIETVTVGAAGFDTASILEWNLDSQASLSAAGGQVGKMILYVGTQLDDASLTEAYNQAVSDDVAQVINVSIGECESSAAVSGTEASDDAIFQIAMAQGQTFAVATGDSGAFECTSTKGSGQSYPAVSPYVMAIGGTEVWTTGGSTWARENAWSCASPLECNRQVAGGTGGGVSKTEPAPAWQLAAGVLGKWSQRGVPDVSFDASPLSGALILVSGSTYKIGGTSLAAPLFTGFWARLQSEQPQPLAFPAPALYQYGQDAADASLIFRDVTRGQNGAYKAGLGWDFASGFGSLDVGALSTFIASHSGF